MSALKSKFHPSATTEAFGFVLSFKIYQYNEHVQEKGNKSLNCKPIAST